MRAFCILLASGLISSVLWACGSDDTNDTGDTGTDDASLDDSALPDAGPSTTYPAFTIDAPQVVTLGGPVLNTPKVEPVFFPGFAYATQMTDFAAKIGASSYWAALAEYKVGALVSATPITLTSADTAPTQITDSQIQDWLRARWDGTHPEFGTAPDSSTIYALYYPSTTTIFLSGGPPSDGGVPDGGGNFGGSKSCSSFGGYHSNIVVGQTEVAYAVVPQCGTFGSFTGVDVVTSTSSHEYSEAVTDPFPMTQAAYTQTDDDHLEWMFFLGGGEIGDMCAQFPTSFYVPTDFNHVVQRNWSNAAAKAGHDPCVPAGTQPYFNTMPVLPDSITTHGATTKGIDVPVGQSKTIELDLFSDQATSGPWTVSAQVFARNGAAPVTATLDQPTGQNGDKLNLTLQSTGALSGTSKTAAVVVTSTLGGRENLWIGLLGQ